jgi:hypothetical protein
MIECHYGALLDAAKGSLSSGSSLRRLVGHDVDHDTVQIANEEAPYSPRLISQRVQDVVPVLDDLRCIASTYSTSMDASGWTDAVASFLITLT